MMPLLRYWTGLLMVVPFASAPLAMTVDDNACTKALYWTAAEPGGRGDTPGFSTLHAARYAAGHWGFAGPAGKTFELEFDRGRQGKKRLTLTCDKSGGEPRYVGPIFPPKDLE